MSEIIDTEGRALQPMPERAAQPLQAVSSRPMDLVRLALERGDGIEVLEKLMALQERQEANDARRQFNAAFARFKSKAVRIIRRTVIKDGPLKGKVHANLFDVVDATTQPLADEGLSLSWKLTKDEKDWIEVTCYLRHSAGHCESVSMGAGPDTGPGRNAIQARCSSKSYLERYTATAITGLASTEQDDDGAGGAALELISHDQCIKLTERIAEVKADKVKFMIHLKVNRLEDLPAQAFNGAMADLDAKAAEAGRKSK